MKKKLNIVMIGAGGIGSHLLPSLLRSFDVSGTLYDKDTLEERNLDRQLFSPSDIGENKAQALLKINGCESITAVDEWYESQMIPANTDLIICVPDNHFARKNALATADMSNTPCVIAGNGFFESEAYFYKPEWKGTKMDPRVMFPEINSDKSGAPNTSCTGEAQIAVPQLCIANMSAAVKVLELIFVNLVMGEKMEDQNLNFLPCMLFTNLSKTYSLNPNDTGK